MSDHMDKPLDELAADIVADGIVDADEVAKMRERLYADGIIDRAEADFLFAVTQQFNYWRNYLRTSIPC